MTCKSTWNCRNNILISQFLARKIYRNPLPWQPHSSVLPIAIHRQLIEGMMSVVVGAVGRGQRSQAPGVTLHKPRVEGVHDRHTQWMAGRHRPWADDIQTHTNHKTAVPSTPSLCFTKSWYELSTHLCMKWLELGSIWVMKHGIQFITHVNLSDRLTPEIFYLCPACH